MRKSKMSLTRGHFGGTPSGDAIVPPAAQKVEAALRPENDPILRDLLTPEELAAMSAVRQQQLQLGQRRHSHESQVNNDRMVAQARESRIRNDRQVAQSAAGRRRNRSGNGDVRLLGQAEDDPRAGERDQRVDPLRGGGVFTDPAQQVGPGNVQPMPPSVGFSPEDAPALKPVTPPDPNAPIVEPPDSFDPWQNPEKAFREPAPVEPAEVEPPAPPAQARRKLDVEKGMAKEAPPKSVTFREPPVIHKQPEPPPELLEAAEEPVTAKEEAVEPKTVPEKKKGVTLPEEAPKSKKKAAPKSKAKAKKAAPKTKKTTKKK